MSAPLSVDNGTSLRDPFRLDHLADELASREAAHLNSSSFSDNEHVRRLPEYIPLSHDDEYLTAQVFNVQDFLLARSHTSLPDLRAELRQYLANLKEELVQLINDDYEAFISLSTDLRDEGSRLERLKYPLRNLRVTVLESKEKLQTIQDDIYNKLSKRGRLREEKALLHLLLKISESVGRLESMLLITPPDEGRKDPIDMPTAGFILYPTSKDEVEDEKSRANHAKHLSRITAEYTQLLYHAQKARADKCIFVDEIQWRIDRIQSTISSDLDQLFSQTIKTLVNQKSESRGSDLERNKWISDITECLKTYDTLGLWRDAEDIIRRDAVRGFVKKTIYPGALTAPHSPLVPSTPFHFPTGKDAMTSLPTSHQIPYTPFTAFVPKQVTHQTPAFPSDLPRAQLLDDKDNSLARLYNQVLRFVERDVGRIMDVAESLSIKPSGDKNGGEESTSLQCDNESRDTDRGFQIMANVVWDELGNAIIDEIGGIVFSVGRPGDFRKHYETTQSFIRSLELLAPTMRSIEAMRRHPTYIAFERRWQLPVYFQLRWKEIVGTLEEMFSGVRLDPIIPQDGSFAMPQSAAAWIAVSACWSSEIFIPELSHRFWKLTLQILSRYRTWLGESISSFEAASQGQQDKQNAPPTSGIPPRASTPAVDASANELSSMDDTILRYEAAAIIDIRLMETNVMTLWRQVIAMMLPDASHSDEDCDFQTQGAIRESVSSLTAFITPLSTNIVNILTRRCCEVLLKVRSIPQQFRAMSNKRVPTEPSYFVASILRPLKQFFGIDTTEGLGRLLRDTFLQEYATEVFTNVTQRYISYLIALKKVEEPLKRLRKNKKPTFSLFGNASTTNDDGKDEECIRTQMILDVIAFGRDAETLQVDVQRSTPFAVLKEMVHAIDPE